jgi:predicted nuclease of restriction endonuclease-like RecB superfamily
MEKCLFQPVQEIDFSTLRDRVFSFAQNYYPVVSKRDLIHQNTRRDILEKICEELKIQPDEIDTLLYGDLPENQILISFDSEYTPESLLKRYNLAMAQGILYHANRIKTLITSDYRTVFQYIKLSRLIHWIKPVESSGMEIILDGPASLFCNTQRYGIRMSNFLPGLLLAEDWKMTAEINTHEGYKLFHLNSECGLSSHYKRQQPFDSQIEENFYNKFSRKKRDWNIEREGEIIDLGDTIFIPDFTFRHKDGRTAYLEIVGFWTPEYLEKKITKLKQAQLTNLILAVNSQLNCSRNDFHGELMFFRTGIRLNEILEKIEKAAK